MILWKIGNSPTLRAEKALPLEQYMYLLDTNICIYIIRNRPVSVRERFNELSLGDVAISVITEAELRYGAAKSSYPEKNNEALTRFLLPFDILPFTSEAVTAYAAIRAALERKGTPIGAMDLLIAAQAQLLNATLVTNNMKEFGRVDGLQLENWVA